MKLTKEEVLELISMAAGSHGIYMFEHLPVIEFIKWFENNIKYDTEIGKEAGYKVINHLKSF